MSVESDAGWRLTGRTALMLFVGFFGVIFAANGVMLAMALKTNTGLVANEPYRKGLKYNERIAADEQQTALGWTSEMTLAADRRQLAVRFADRDGKPVDGLKVSAELGRPSTNRQDMQLDLAPAAPGLYVAALSAIEAGAYVASLEAASAHGGAEAVVYRARRRLWVNP